MNDFNPEYFNEGYYGSGERGGFKSYDYDSAVQKHQLQMKWVNCSTVPHDSVLFVGCATGFEVAYWTERHKNAFGVDVSRWAIDHPHPLAKGRISHFDGASLSGVSNDAVDLVAAFDVLTLPPMEMLEDLASEMVRVAKNGIVFRTIIKNFRNEQTMKDGQDGVEFVYKPFNTWCRLFAGSGKFNFHSCQIHHQYESIFVFKRA